LDFNLWRLLLALGAVVMIECGASPADFQQVGEALVCASPSDGPQYSEACLMAFDRQQVFSFFLALAVCLIFAGLLCGA